ncbi:MAG: ATP-binding protein [Cytophagales bacterium]|nr:ATP-binding protein [Armatimonadota bacterium]
MSNENDRLNSQTDREVSSEDAAATVTLTIPCTPEYVGTARLTILGVASRMGFSYDQVEDIRLAVGEACANAIERAKILKVENPLITIRSLVEPSKLTVEVEDHTDNPSGEGIDQDKPAAEIESMNSQELGALLMEILVDEVSVEPASGGGTRVRLVKFANES